MALLAGSTNPCNELNSTAYPSLWISNTMEAIQAVPLLAKAGVTYTFGSFLSSPDGPKDLSANILRPKASIAGSSLLQFLEKNPSLRQNLLTNKTIVDSYLKAPVSTLITDGFLLSESEIYSSDSTSLFELYKLQKAGTALTNEQKTRQATLLAKNNRFFAAFLVEYCFYRSRYLWCLKKYFEVQNDKCGNPPRISDDITQNLFSGSNSPESALSPNQFLRTTAPTLRKADYLRGLSFHMTNLNTFMTDMRALLSSIEQYYSNLFKKLNTALLTNTDLVGSAENLQSVITSLNTSANDAKKYMSETDFLKASMEYAAQKNRYSNVLLGLYAILNISALAIIFKLR